MSCVYRDGSLDRGAKRLAHPILIRIRQVRAKWQAHHLPPQRLGMRRAFWTAEPCVGWLLIERDGVMDCSGNTSLFETLLYRVAIGH